jgi:hypothetical protein
MPWGRKSHFFCTVDSARTAQTRICSDRYNGFRIIAAGWLGAVVTRISHSVLHGDEFEVRFEPWLNSKAKNGSVCLASGYLNFDTLGPKLVGESRAEWPLVRLDQDILAALEFVRAKQIMMEGIDTQTT